MFLLAFSDASCTMLRMSEKIHAARIHVSDDPGQRREVTIDRLERRIGALQDLCDLMMVDSLVMAPVREAYAHDIQGIVSVMQSALETLATFRVELLEEAHKEAIQALRDDTGEDEGVDHDGVKRYDA